MKIHAICQPDIGPILFFRIERRPDHWWAGMSIGLDDKFDGYGKSAEEAIAVALGDYLRTRTASKTARKAKKPAKRKRARK